MCETALLSTISPMRNRAEKYTHKELKFLLGQVKKYPNIIESPNSHSETKRRKSLIWHHISHQLQINFPYNSPKTASHLRNWWKRTKSRAKQRLNVFRNMNYRENVNKVNQINDGTENSRGYLEQIFMEICDFRDSVISDYTAEKEDVEYAAFLDEINIERKSNDKSGSIPYSPTICHSFEECEVDSFTFENNENNFSVDHNSSFKATSPELLVENTSEIFSKYPTYNFNVPTLNNMEFNCEQAVSNLINNSPANQVMINTAIRLLSQYKNLIISSDNKSGQPIANLNLIQQIMQNIIRNIFLLKKDLEKSANNNYSEASFKDEFSSSPDDKHQSYAHTFSLTHPQSDNLKNNESGKYNENLDIGGEFIKVDNKYVDLEYEILVLKRRKLTLQIELLERYFASEIR